MIKIIKSDFEGFDDWVHIVEPTRFPDGTSQSWKLPEFCFYEMFTHIIWDFESELEIMPFLQTVQLLSEKSRVDMITVPFMPYSRQDKEISNESTFALKTFIDVLSLCKNSHIRTIDVHNPKSLPKWIHNVLPDYQINHAINEVKPDIICFPDKGASTRGYNTQGLPFISLDKKRNQLTGEIEGLEYNGDLELRGKSLLILDDLIDGGRTFIEASKLLDSLGASDVNLYGSHGIFSKGTKVLFDSNIKRIFTIKGEVRNEIK